MTLRRRNKTNETYFENIPKKNEIELEYKEYKAKFNQLSILKGKLKHTIKTKREFHTLYRQYEKKEFRLRQKLMDMIPEVN